MPLRRRPGRAIAAAPGGFLHLSLLASLRRRPSLQAHAQLLLLGLPLPAAAASRLLRPHLRSGHPAASLRLFLRVLRGDEPGSASAASEEAVPSSYSLSAALAACARHASPSPGFSVHAFLLKSGFAADLFAANSLLHFYASFGLHSLARKLFDEMPARDTVSFNTLIVSYVQSGRIEEAVGVFRDMVGEGFRLDRWSITSSLGMCAGLGDLRAAKAAHGVATRALKMELFDSGEAVIVLVDMYAKCGAVQLARRVFDLSREKARTVRVWTTMMSAHARAGEIDTARRLFDEMPNKDLVAWTVLIGGFVQAAKYDEALRLFEEMEAAGLEADEVTVVTVLSACVHHGRLDLAKRLHRLVDQNGLISRNARLATSFVHMYAKHGCIKAAMDVFCGVGAELKTLELFNAMINGLAHLGCGEEAISLFDDMRSLGLRPDQITFVGVLSACSRRGLVQKGFQMFNSMVDKYGVQPDIKHYACMADLLGRAGRLDDAYSFIQNMPFKANHVVWSSLLTACRIHRNNKIGDLAEKQLLKFDTNCKPEALTFPDLFSDNKRKWRPGRVRKVTAHVTEKQLPKFDTTCKPERLALSGLISDEARKERRVRKVTKQKAKNQLLESKTTCEPEKLTSSDLFSDEKRKWRSTRVKKVTNHKAKKQLLEFDTACKPGKLAFSALVSDEKIIEQPAIVGKVTTHKAEKQLPKFDATCKPERLALSGLYTDEKRKERSARVRKVTEQKEEKKTLDFDSTCEPVKLSLSGLFSNVERKDQPARVTKVTKQKAEEQLLVFDTTYNPENLSLTDPFSDEKSIEWPGTVRKFANDKAEKQLLEFDISNNEKVALSGIFSDENTREQLLALELSRRERTA
ncbi:hypothetical protein ACP4OV_000056 [Aristida adscensionis]